MLFVWGEYPSAHKLMAGVVLISIFTIAINESLRAWEQRLGRWRVAS